MLYATVRRWYGPVAGLLAGAVVAVTPVATLMFRFNNPDALLVLLLVGAAYAAVRATEVASARWLALAGALVGFGFLAKMLQALLVVPALALVYLVAAPAGGWRRVRGVLLAGLAMVVAAGWWVAIVSLVPAADRPYIGGSQTNSILELTLGYNGLGRITGNQVGSVGGGGGQAGRWGVTGWTRLFDPEIGGQISWLLPGALILLVAGIVWTRRRPRTDRLRAGFLVWGGWLLVTGITFSLMRGIFHAYYTVALAPAIGALVGMGAVVLWRRRSHVAVSAVLAVTVAVTAVWAWVLLGRSPEWHPWLRPSVLVVGLLAAAALLLGARLPRVLATAAAAVAVMATLAAPLASSVTTAAQAHTGAIPSAGPTVAGAGFGPGGSAGGAGGGFRQPGGTGLPGGLGGPRGGAFPGGTGPNGGGTGNPGGTGPDTGGGVGGPGGGGLLDARTPNAALVAALQANADRYTWVAAAVGANNAAGLQLATGKPVMPIGGFNGSDPSPTLAQFQQDVAAGKIHYFLGGSGPRSNGGSSASAEIAQWVSQTFTVQTIGGQTVYDLSAGAGR
jgi:4-amino-4-deoxy-L-arabinose transferase-like glycosyltransferase